MSSLLAFDTPGVVNAAREITVVKRDGRRA